MEKYYTPQLNEFAYGFEDEYQEFFGADFVGKIFTGFDNSEVYSWVNKSKDIPDCLAPIFYRVKYLDSEDIENLGWAKEGIEYKTIVNNNCFYLHKTDLNVTIYSHLITSISQAQSRLFKGKIKNKSELSQIMKMVGII